MTDKTACMILNMLSGMGPAKLNGLMNNFSSPSEILKSSAENLKKIPGIGTSLAETIASAEQNSDWQKELELIDKAGVKIITIVDDEYPEILRETATPPICLYLRGKMPENHELCLSVVGSRRTSLYGRRMTERIVSSASLCGWTIISGLANGIDTEAHKSTLVSEGKTVAVLGSGLAKLYPKDNIPLAKEIIENGGAVISEFPMNFPPTRQTFPMRNRIVSGLSKGTLVVEAGLNSGSLITANFATEQNRLVFAVPAQADKPSGRGCNKLIKSGAKLTETFEDIVEEFEFLPGFSVSKADEVGEEEDSECFLLSKLSEDEVKVLKQTKQESSIDEIALKTQIPSGKLLAILMKLEMKMLVEELPGGKYLTVKKVC